MSNNDAIIKKLNGYVEGLSVQNNFQTNFL